MLSDNDKRFLDGLRSDPRWIRILKYIEKKPPTYQPSEDTEEQKLISKFIYESGVFNENERILKMLNIKGN